MMRLLGVTCIVATSIAGLAHQQRPPRDQFAPLQTGTATITGRVVAKGSTTMTPIRSALVTLTRAGGEDLRTVATGEDGSFSFINLPAARYTLSASKGGYLSANYGALQDGMPGTAIPLRDGDRFAAHPIVLMRGVVIAGRISGRFGRPLAEALVTVVQIVVINGERRARAGSWRSTRSNAHGEYRVFGLPAGEYVLYAEAPREQMLVREITAGTLAWAERPTGTPPTGEREATYAPTVFPGTADRSAAAHITLAGGEERSDVDLTMQSPAVADVSGMVAGPDGQPGANVSVTREVRQQDAIFPELGAAVRTDAAGRFTFQGVPPGEFVLTARTVSAEQPSLWGRTEVSVNGDDLRDRVIRLQPALTLRGRVALKAGPQSGPRPRITIALSPGGRTLSADVLPSSDGTFAITGIVPGTFRVVTSVGSPLWTVHSILQDGRDLADTMLEVREDHDLGEVVVTLSDRMAELSGTLTDGAGRPAHELYVFLFPVDTALWTRNSRRIRAVRADVGGGYAVTGLPPGEYYVSASTAIDPALQYDPTYLELFVAAALKVSISDGETRKLDLRVGAG